MGSSRKSPYMGGGGYIVFFAHPLDKVKFYPMDICIFTHGHAISNPLDTLNWPMDNAVDPMENIKLLPPGRRYLPLWTRHPQPLLAFKETYSNYFFIHSIFPPWTLHLLLHGQSIFTPWTLILCPMDTHSLPHGHSFFTPWTLILYPMDNHSLPHGHSFFIPWTFWYIMVENIFGNFATSLSLKI